LGDIEATKRSNGRFSFCEFCDLSSGNVWSHYWGASETGKTLSGV